MLESFGLTEADLLRIREHGIGPDQLLVQVRHYQLGYPPLQIDKAASPGQGIRQLSATELDHYGKLYSSFQGDLRLCKFVPASGAASRMFRDLAAFLHQEDSEKILEFF